MRVLRFDDLYATLRLIVGLMARPLSAPGMMPLTTTGTLGSGLRCDEVTDIGPAGTTSYINNVAATVGAGTSTVVGGKLWLDALTIEQSKMLQGFTLCGRIR
jgi:hypothetical protein